MPDDGVCMSGAVGGGMIDGRTFFLFDHKVFPLRFVLKSAAVGLAVKQGRVAILFTAQVSAQGEDVVGRVLVHRRMGCRTDEDDRIATETYEHHKQTQ